jgi:hypothetical protein
MWDWGHIKPEGVRSAMTNAQLEAAWNWRRTDAHARVLPLYRVAAHLAMGPLDEVEKYTLYMRSSRLKRVQVVAIDIDAHHGEGDALALSEYFLALLPTYREPSTNDKGIHHLVMLDRGEVPPRLFNRFVAIFARALSALAKENNFDALVEVKGRCTVDTEMPDGSRALVRGDRGTLIKTPRLRHGQASMDELDFAPRYTLTDLFTVVALAPEHAGLVTAWQNLEIRLGDEPPILHSQKSQAARAGTLHQ